MKVLHIYKDYHPVLGGIENHIRLLCRHLKQERDINPVVLVTNPSPRTIIENDDGISVIKAARLATVSSTPIAWGLTRWIRRQDPDLIHLHFPYPIGELAYLLVGTERKMVLTYHSDIIRQRWLLLVYRPFLKRVLERAKRIIVSSPDYAKSSAYLQKHQHKCVTIPFGVDLERFKTVRDASKIADLRSRYSTPLVLFVGLLRYYKGVSFLIEAMKELGGSLLIVGEGPRRSEWEQHSRRLGLDGRVHFLGRVPDDELPALYHACDIFVLPSSYRSEALGIAQLEAMACGKPVICTDLGTGTTFANIHETTGLVVPPADAVALAAALHRLMSEPDLQARLGKAGRERVEEHFSASRMASQMARLYRSL